MKTKHQRGLSLIELMVGLTIAMLVGLAALGSTRFFMASNRQAAGASTALGDASLAVAALKNELSQAGLGLFAQGALLCPVANVSVGPSRSLESAPLAPVVVSMTGSESVIDVTYATRVEATAPTTLDAPFDSSSSSLALASFLPVSVGDAVIIAPAPGTASACSIRTATSVQEATQTAPQILSFGPDGQHNQGDFGAQSYPASAQVVVAGELRRVRFQVNNGRLTMSRPWEGVAVDLANNVVALDARYGVFTAGQGMTSWEPAANAWANLSSAQSGQVRALEVSMLVRSDTAEKPDASGSCTTTLEPPLLNGRAVTLPADWRCTRFRTVSTVVPLRNVTMGVS